MSLNNSNDEKKTTTETENETMIFCVGIFRIFLNYIRVYSKCRQYQISAPKRSISPEKINGSEQNS